MAPVERYLHEYFLPTERFAERCGIGSAELADLIAAGIVPGPTYQVDGEGNMHSHVFGAVAAPGAPAGHWFHAHAAAWVERGRRALAENGSDRTAAAAALMQDFRDRYRNALLAEHEAYGPIPGLVDADGRFDDAAFEQQFPETWEHFLAGTFGLCVSVPDSETRIAAKEATQARLAQATANGQRRDFSPGEADAVRRLIERYVEVSMPFSPAEYPRSSRKRLVEDVLAHLPHASA